MAGSVNLFDELETLFPPDRKPRFTTQPKEWWYKIGHQFAEQSAFVAESDCRGLMSTVLELRRDDYWRQFSDSWDGFCLEFLHRPAAWIEQIAEGVLLLAKEQPAVVEEAIPAAKAQTAQQMAIDLEGKPLAKHGEIGRGRAQMAQQMAADLQDQPLSERNRRYDVTSTQRGNDQTYLLRRLWRDRPDLAQKVADGEFPSARAAALEAGIVRRTIAIDAEDPARAAASLLRRDQQLAIDIAHHILNRTQPPTD